MSTDFDSEDFTVTIDESSSPPSNRPRPSGIPSTFEISDKQGSTATFSEEEDFDVTTFFSTEKLKKLAIGAKDQIIRPSQQRESRYNNPILRYIDNYFRITTLKSRISTEIIGGITSYLTTVYILYTNAAILSATGMPYDEVFVATAVLAGTASITLGLIGGFPIIMAPGMGMNVVFAFDICGLKHYTYKSALGITLLAGVFQFLIVTFGFTKKFIKAIPEYYRIGLAVGIGLFLALIGSIDFQLIVGDPATLITLGDFTWRVGLGLLGLLIMGSLILREWRGAFLISIASVCVASAIIRAIWERDGLKLDTFGDLSLGTIAGSLNFDFDARAIYLIPLVTFHHMFDAVATSLVLLRQAYFSNTKVQFRGEDIEHSLASSLKVRYLLMIDSIFVIISALLGSSLTTPFIESATGISVGAKTGLASCVAGVLFLISTFIGPIIEYIVPEATGPALIVTSMVLMPQLKHLNWDKMEEVLPAMLTLIMIPFTYSIASGSAFGYCFILTWVIAGKFKQISPAMWVLIAISLFQLLAHEFGFNN